MCVSTDIVYCFLFLVFCGWLVCLCCVHAQWDENYLLLHFNVNRGNCRNELEHLVWNHVVLARKQCFRIYLIQMHSQTLGVGTIQLQHTYSVCTFKKESLSVYTWFQIVESNQLKVRIKVQVGGRRSIVRVVLQLKALGMH